MKRLGIIDVGSNSVRLIIMDVDGTNAHHQIENIKETVRLSSGLMNRAFSTKKPSACH